nr:hypothetical protein [Sphingomonas sp.]
MMPIQMPLPPTRLANTEQPAILLFGDSHSHAVHLAVEKRLGTQCAAPLAVFRQLKEKNGRKVGNITFDGFLKRISQLSGEDVVLSMMGGNRHAIFGTTQHPQPFDFYSRDHRAPPRCGVEIISYRTLAAFFAKGISERVGRRLKAMRKATAARVVHLVPPPPKADNEYIALHHEKLYAIQGIHSQGVSPPELRLKFWLLQARILQQLCPNWGVDVMMPPPETMREGFLRPEYYWPDTTHANRLYGEVMLRSVEAE